MLTEVNLKNMYERIERENYTPILKQYMYETKDAFINDGLDFFNDFLTWSDEGKEKDIQDYLNCIDANDENFLEELNGLLEEVEDDLINDDSYVFQFDNGGGVIFQTAEYCHYYHDGKAAGEDYLEYLEDEETYFLAENQPEFRITNTAYEKDGTSFFLWGSDLQEIMYNEELKENFSNENVLEFLATIL